MPAKKNPIKTWEQKFIRVLSDIASKHSLEVVTSSEPYDRRYDFSTINIYFQPKHGLINYMAVKLVMRKDEAQVILKPNLTDEYQLEENYNFTSITDGEHFQDIANEIDKQFNKYLLRRALGLKTTKTNEPAEPIDASSFEVHP